MNLIDHIGDHGRLYRNSGMYTGMFIGGSLKRKIFLQGERYLTTPKIKSHLTLTPPVLVSPMMTYARAYKSGKT